jgi:hypothetical protein
MRKDGFMQRDDMRFAVAAREDGLRRVRSLTVQIGAAGVVSAAVIAVALGHPAGATIHNTTGGGTSKNQTGPNETSPGSGTSQGNSSPGNSQQGTSPQAPAQNLAPAAGSGQAVSGGS